MRPKRTGCFFFLRGGATGRKIPPEQEKAKERKGEYKDVLKALMLRRFHRIYIAKYIS